MTAPEDASTSSPPPADGSRQSSSPSGTGGEPVAEGGAASTGRGPSGLTEDALTGSLLPPAPAGPVDFAEPPIVGERIGVPSGAARLVPDPHAPRPSYVFFFVVAILSFVSDVGTKLWAEKRLEMPPGVVEIVPDHLQLVLARNKGGAWGLLQSTSENVRRPFFLLVSAAAIVFIMTLFRRLQPGQRALKWGLPLVLGGALGNVFDRIRYGHVIDFIDYRAEWVRSMNDFFVRTKIAQMSTDHWPTFNVADVWICVGVGLMAIDMLTAKRVRTGRTLPPPPPSLPPPPVETRAAGAETASPTTASPTTASATTASPSTNSAEGAEVAPAGEEKPAS